MQVCRFRARGVAAEGGVSPLPGCPPIRRGYGGLRPHPLKGHWPLRIPLAAASTPMLQHKPGGPCSWAVRRALLSLPVRNATKNPCPLLLGQGFAAPPRQRWLAALPPYLPTQKLAFLPFPGCFPFRRGYGGLRPHPLKGHWPLRIPLAAAQFPLVTTQAGRPLLMGRPARFVPFHNQKRNKARPPPTRGAGAHRSSAAALAGGTAALFADAEVGEDGGDDFFGGVAAGNVVQ